MAWNHHARLMAPSNTLKAGQDKVSDWNCPLQHLIPKAPRKCGIQGSASHDQGFAVSVAGLPH